MSAPTTGSTGRGRRTTQAIWAILVAVAVLLGLSAAPALADGAGATPPGKAWIRAGHFVPGFGAARVDLLPKAGTGASILMSPNAGYGDVTSYQKVEPGV